MFRQGSLPGGGAHSLKVAQLVHTGRRHRERGVFRGDRPGEPRLGHTARSTRVLLVVFMGEGEASRTWPEMAFQKAAASKRDWQERDQRAVVPGTGKDGGASAGRDEEKPREVKAGERSAGGERLGAHGKGLSPLPGRAVLLFSLDFPDRAEVLARTACEAYLPDPRAPSNL